LANKNSNKGRQQRQRYRTSAAAARARKRTRQRGIATGVVALFIVLALVGLIFSFGAASKNNASSTTTAPSTTTPTTAPTSTSAPLPSVAGKPCVAMKGPLPAGAPAVPVQTGPPPKTLVTKDLQAGTGAVVKAGETLTVDYIGVSCSTGKIFDSSYARKQPATFALSGVIAGWQQGLPGMKVGGERLLGIPPTLGYGTAGQGPDIAPNETLWFVVHVRSAK
jgi:peptidylprolyl isomerase